MYCGINTQIFKDIPCISGIVSAAEMLLPRYPTIAGSFLQYATGLVQNYLSQAGSTPELDQAYSMLKQVTSNCQFANPKDLESFGDCLVASANEPYTADFYRLAYVAYASTSFYGQISTRVLNKIANTQQYLNLDSTNVSLQFTQGISSQFPGGGPPQFTPYGSTPNGPPQFTPNGPPQFTPNGPPQFTPFGDTKSTSTLPKQAPSNSTYNQGFPQYPTNITTNNASNPNANPLKLAEMAKNAMDSGNNDMALSLIYAAMKELEKK